jgi:hypothetical protein
MFLKLTMLLLSCAVFAQEELPPAVVELVRVETPQELQKLGIHESEINHAIEASKKDLLKLVGEEEFKKFKPIGVDVDEARITTKATSDFTKALRDPEQHQVPFLCEKDKSPIVLATENAQKIIQNLESEEGKGNGGMVYITWGYNRSWFSDADTTFHTPDGTFTVKQARAKDRPSTQLKTYLDVKNFSIPQYNVRIGYKFNKKWSVEIGTDHMKWVFANKGNYEITGNYNRPVWIHDGNWGNDHQATFEEAKAAGNATFLQLEHSDGYNYPHATAFFTQTLLESKNKRFRLDGSFGLGAGVLFPKTRVQIRDQENNGEYRDVDNKFHVAGWGTHAEANANFIYKAKKSGREYFLQASNRGHVGKINNSLFLGSDSGRISQAPIYTYEVYVSAGVAQPVFAGKKKKKK